jgi:hypothetical protein
VARVVSLCDACIAKTREHTPGPMTYADIARILQTRVDVHRELLNAIEREARELAAGSIGDRYRGRYGKTRAHDDAIAYYVADIASFVNDPRELKASDVLFNRRTAHAWALAHYVREARADVQ